MITLQALGNVGGDPIVKTTDGGKRYARFSIAVNKTIKGEKTTTWVNVTSFDDKKTELIEKYVKKGDKLFIEGEPSARAYDKDGQAQASLDVVLGFGSKIAFAGSSADTEGDRQEEPQKQDELDDDIPF